MALWARTQQLTGNFLKQIQELYTIQFPMEVRHCIADWIEQQNWKEVDANCDEAAASYLMNKMVEQITHKASTSYTSDELFPYKLRLLESAECLQVLYRECPLELVRLIMSCLHREEQLILISQDAMPHEQLVTSNERMIFCDMEKLRSDILEASKVVKQQQQKQESFVLRYQHSLTLNERLKSMNIQQEISQKQETNRFQEEVQKAQLDLKEKGQQLASMRVSLREHLVNIVGAIKRLVNLVLDHELSAWKGLQKMATFKDDLCETHVLNKIQKWCEELVTAINDCKQQVLTAEMLESQLPIAQVNSISEVNNELQLLLHHVLLKSFVVDRQPPQVVRKDARFTTSVRMLVGNKLNIFMNTPTVEATIINELQARQIARDGLVSPETNNINSGSILNQKGTMEYAHGQLTLTFRNMQLKKIKRSDRKGQELVVEEKFCLLFRSKIQAGKEYEIWTMSLPIVVTVHGNQDCQAQATVLWDNAFSDQMRPLFQVPDQVLWVDLTRMLSDWFKQKTGAALTYDHQQYLAAKIFGEGITDVSNHMITRAAFHKDPLQFSNRNFSFWEWLFSIQKVTKDNLKQLWMDGLIMGFVSKKCAQDLLLARPPGTFLLRFSDTELGGISIVYNCIEPGTDKLQVCNLSPFTDRDFRVRCLADRVKDLPVLSILYPDFPKEVAFGKFWTKDGDVVQQTKPGDYIKHTLSMTIPGMPAAPGPNCTPNYTPQMSPAPISSQAQDPNRMDLIDYEADELVCYLSPAGTDFSNDDLPDLWNHQFMN